MARSPAALLPAPRGGTRTAAIGHVSFLVHGGGSFMARRAFKLELKPGCQDIYKEKHDNIWPELVELFKQSTVSNYSIFLNGTELFGYLEVQDLERFADLPNHPVMQRWWQMMEPYMVYTPDHRPKQIDFTEVFHLD
jgi:L-rhamnose mutarotase